MMFLAVTFGFFAENLRDDLNDRAKEKQYIESLIHNLNDDVVNLRHVIQSDGGQAKGIDSMLVLSRANMDIDANRASFYYYVNKYCYNSSTFKSNDATLQQLKSTGDLRLIEKDHVADSLIKYDTDLRTIYKQGDYYEVYFKDILSRLDELIDMTVIADTSFAKNQKATNKSFPRLRATNNDLVTLFNKLIIFKIITSAYVDNNLLPQLKNSERLIKFLKSEYGIE